MRRCRVFPAGSTSPGCLRQPATGSLRSCWLSFLHSHMRASPRLNFGVWRSRRQYTLSRSAGVHIITDGSSIPRGRGSPKAVQARDGFDRFTPARAGQASRPRAKPRRSWAYPRACGAAPCGRIRSRCSVGQFPRVRGSPPARISADLLPSASRAACRRDVSIASDARYLHCLHGSILEGPSCSRRRGRQPRRRARLPQVPRCRRGHRPSRSTVIDSSQPRRRWTTMTWRRCAISKRSGSS